MTESEIKEKWYYFCSLAKQFQATEQYVVIVGRKSPFEDAYDFLDFI